jgi:hypothetical protein
VYFVQNVQVVQPLRSVQSPSLVLPRVAGEETGGGWNDLNYLNGWNSDKVKQSRNISPAKKLF